MTGETIFRALVAIDVADVASSLTVVDKGQLTLAIMEGKFRVLPKKVQAALNALAFELDNGAK